MTIKHYIHPDNTYAGGTERLQSLTEVPTAPDNAHQIWNGTDWNPLVISQIEQDLAYVKGGLLKVAQTVIDIGEALVAQNALDISLMSAADRQNFVALRDVIARIKANI